MSNKVDGVPGVAPGPVPGACRNCAGPLAPTMRYCPACGQGTALHPPTALEFVHEFIGHYIAVEGSLWRTLGLLFFKPGQLTVEYLVGRKLRYVLPLRLYLTLSLVALLLMGLLATSAVKVNNDTVKQQVAQGKGVLIGAQGDNGRYFGARLFNDGRFECNLPGWVCTRLHDKLLKMREAPVTEVQRSLGTLGRDWPYAMFLLMPFFALLLKAVYARRGRLYGEHLVFTLHVHAAWFVLAALSVLLPDSVAGLAVLAMPVYLALALQRVYGGRVWATLLRLLALALPYLLAAALVLLILGAYAFLS